MIAQSDKGEIKFQPGLRYINISLVKIKFKLIYYRELIMTEYLNPFLDNQEDYPVTIMLFRDQTHLAKTAEILSMK
jgi:hypothetical protein